MKIRAWVLKCGSGMHRVAESICEGEAARGLDSALVDVEKEAEWEEAADADVHVVHTHFPSKMLPRLTKPRRLVWVGHGTPDHVFHSAAEAAQSGTYGAGDALMLMQHWMQHADARVTFWDRHKWIYDRMSQRGARPTDLLPLGVDRTFWGASTSRGKYVGEPSVFTGENPHYIKWPYDLLTAWGEVTDAVPDARLHAIYLARDLHRVFIPWCNAIGSAYGAYLSPMTFDKDWLRNAFKSTDYYCGLVRYGDHNHMGMQANAAGAKTISFVGNPYSDFWVPEGDQRLIAKELIAILKGERETREKTQVPDLSDTVDWMLKVYEDICP
jgi:hypothetical protein